MPPTTETPDADGPDAVALTSGSPRPSVRLSEAQVDRLVELKLERWTTRAVATELGTTDKTVRRHWEKHRSALALARVDKTEEERAENIARLERIAIDARRGAKLARATGRPKDEIAFLTLEARIVAEQSKLAGLDKITVEHTGAVGIVPVIITEYVEGEDIIDVDVIETTALGAGDDGND